MATTVTYNAQAPWTGTNSPYVSVSYQPTDFGGTWVNVYTITLTGSVSKDIVGNLDTIKNNIITTFSINNRALHIVGNGGIVTYNNCFVDAVSFPQQNQIGKLDYSVTLRQYDFFLSPGNLSGAMVLEPKDIVEGEEQKDGSTRMSHTVSAQGVDDLTPTSGSTATGMQNAIDFVTARIAVVPTAIAHFKTGMQPMEMEEVETFNRLTSTYSITKTYLVDGDPSNNTYKRSSVSVSSSINEDFEKVDITVEYKGGKVTTVANLVSAVENESVIYAEAASISGVSNLHNQADSFTVDENINEKTVTVKASFDNNSCFDANGRFFDYEVSLDTDYITGVTKVDVSGELQVRGDLSNKNSRIDSFINSTDLDDYLRGLAFTTYQSVVGGTFSFGPIDSLLISRNESKGTLRLSASFNDEDSFSGYSEANWSMSITSPVAYTKVHPSATENGHWSIQYFGFTTRETASTSVNLTSATNPDKTFSSMQTQAVNTSNNLFGVMAGNYYTLSEDENTKESSTLSISQTKQRSYTGGGAPLIVLGVGGSVPSPPF
jgi:hypothetical protein